MQYHAQRIILVGDPKQLDATVISQRAAVNGLKSSLFTRLFPLLQQANRVHVLTEQVRNQ